MQLGHDDLSSTNSVFRVFTYGDASTMIYDCNGTVLLEHDFDRVAVPSEVLIDRIVNNFPYAVVQSGTVVWVTKVHSRAFTNGFKTLKDLDTVCFVIRIAHVFTIPSLVLSEDPRRGSSTVVPWWSVRVIE